MPAQTFAPSEAALAASAALAPSKRAKFADRAQRPHPTHSTTGGKHAARRHTRCAIALAAALLMSCASFAHAQSAPPNDASPTAPAPQPHHADAADLYLDVSLNGERTGLIVHFIEREGRLFASAADLSAIGLRLPASHSDSADAHDVAGVAAIALDALPGLRYRYDKTVQSIALDAPDALRSEHTVDPRAHEAGAPANASRGVVVNYDAYAAQGGGGQGAQAALWAEQRYFDAHGAASNTGTVYMSHQQPHYVRFDSFWRESNPGNMSTMQFGDTISSSLDWSRPVRIGGFQWRSNFPLRPGLVAFAMPTPNGSAALPSAVDLYVNNVHQSSGTVPSGPFVINNVPGISGAGEATVVTRDALGRAVTTTIPLYVDARLLPTGLSSYSVETGFLRRDYAVQSFSYDARPVASGSYRHGVNDRLTLEAHAEVASGVYDVGAGALVRMGQLGVINSSLAGSTGQLTGGQVGLGYQLTQSRFSVALNTLRALGQYGDIGAHDGSPVARATDRATLSMPLPGHGSGALSYIGYRYPRLAPSHIGSLSYTVKLHRRTTVTLSSYRDFAARDTSGVYVSTSLSIGGKTAISGGAGRVGGAPTFNLNASRAPAHEGGWGWAVQDGGSAATHYQQAQTGYLGRYGEVTAMGQALGGKSAASLDASGALVLMDGSAFASRRIDDGFAPAPIDGLAGVPVLREERVIDGTDGTDGTDGQEHPLVSDPDAYQRNRVGIDTQGLPAGTRVESAFANVVPDARTGVLANFHVAPYRAASVILRAPDGGVVPAGARVHIAESGADTIVGYDGVVFIDALQANNHLSVSAGPLHCAVAFHYQRAADGSLPTYGPLTCKAIAAQA